MPRDPTMGLVAGAGSAAALVLVLVGVVATAVSSAACAAVLGLERGELAGDGGGTDAATSSDGANAAAFGDLVQAERPLAYYPFTEPAGAANVANVIPLGSPRERDGVVRGATLGEPGARGGDDHAMVAGTPAARVELAWGGVPPGNGPFGFEVALRAGPAQAEPAVVLSHADSAPGAPFTGYRLLAEGEIVAFERVTPQGTDRVRSLAVLGAARWVYVAVTFDGARLRLLVDGQIADELRSTRSLLGSGTVLAVGSASAADIPFAGRIDELSVYDREVAPAAIAARAALLAR